MMGITNAQTHLWGTCASGGTLGYGTIFKADSNGNNLSTVYEFDDVNGRTPIGNMLLAPNGKIYGVTVLGGCNDSCVIYEYDRVTHTNIDVFDFYCNYGSSTPADGMILGIDGLLYGLTPGGGTYGYGYLYRFNTVTHICDTIYNFNNYTPMGCSPGGKLLQINNKFYGTAEFGGTTGNGVIFCFDLSTSVYSVLHTFNNTDGRNPYYGNLIFGNDGKLYGTTQQGGTYTYGVIFSYDTVANIYSNVYNFDNTHGGNPFGSLISATDGKLYGITNRGGLHNGGVIFNYTISDSTYADVFDFDTASGINPYRGLMQGSNGLLYGTTYNGGSNNYGTFFSYNISSNIHSVLYNFDNGVNGGNPNCDIAEFPDSLTSGIKQISNKESITIYPNPATTTITLHSLIPISNPQSLTITDILGNEVYHQPINNSNNQSIDVSQWSDGVYFYQLKNNMETVRGKFVKE